MLWATDCSNFLSAVHLSDANLLDHSGSFGLTSAFLSFPAILLRMNGALKFFRSITKATSCLLLSCSRREDGLFWADQWSSLLMNSFDVFGIWWTKRLWCRGQKKTSENRLEWFVNVMSALVCTVTWLEWQWPQVFFRPAFTFMHLTNTFIQCNSHIQPMTHTQLTTEEPWGLGSWSFCVLVCTSADHFTSSLC